MARSSIGASAGVLLLLSLGGCIRPQSLGRTFGRGDIEILCGSTAGSPCCRADSRVATSHCARADLGCNVATNRCEACGGPGQVCCDGELTVFSGACYINPLDPKSCESCQEGAFCDARLSATGEWVGSRRCLGCGTVAGGACCPPDARYAVRRCGREATTGHTMTCDNSFGAPSMCLRCGAEGQPGCSRVRPCDPGLTAREGVCVRCGGLGQPSCDGECGAGLVDRGSGTCAPPCGRQGEPCCGDVCTAGYLVCDAGTCRHGGLEGEPCLAGGNCGAAVDGFPLRCREQRCERAVGAKGNCDACRFHAECFTHWEGFEALCLRGECRARLKYDGSLYPNCHPPPDPCAGVVCSPDRRCFEGVCRSCGYPGGECCNGPIFGGCYGGGLLQCGWDNRCG